MQKLTFEDALDILYGCTVLGTGGGGSLEEGIKKIRKNFDDGKSLSIASLSEVPNDKIVACPYHVGSISPRDEMKQINLPTVIENETLHAFKVLEEYMGTKFFGSITTELGGGNTATAMDVAMNLNIPLIDGDPAGRSVPGVQHSSFYIENIKITPAAVVNKFGDVMILKSVVDDFRAEELIRNIAAQSENTVGVVSQPIAGNVLRTAVIPDTITFSQAIGRALRNSKEQGLDPVHEMLKAGKGYFLFEGSIIHDAKWKDEHAYTIGDFEINGIGKFKGHNYKIWFKNENIISWMDGKPDASAPDLICLVEKESGKPITNPHQKAGMKVAVLGFKAAEEWRKKKALEIFTPVAFGFDIPYVPIEEDHEKFQEMK